MVSIANYLFELFVLPKSATKMWLSNVISVSCRGKPCVLLSSMSNAYKLPVEELFNNAFAIIFSRIVHSSNAMNVSSSDVVNAKIVSIVTTISVLEYP